MTRSSTTTGSQCCLWRCRWAAGSARVTGACAAGPGPLCQGHNLAPDDLAPDDLSGPQARPQLLQLVCECFDHEPSLRPTAGEALQRLKAILLDEVGGGLEAQQLWLKRPWDRGCVGP
jgi:hypothetical protein